MKRLNRQALSSVFMLLLIFGFAIRKAWALDPCRQEVRNVNDAIQQYRKAVRDVNKYCPKDAKACSQTKATIDNALEQFITAHETMLEACGLITPPLTAQVLSVQGPDAALVDTVLTVFDCSSDIPSPLSLIITTNDCEDVKDDLRARLTGYIIQGIGIPGEQLDMYLSGNCDPPTEYRQVFSAEVTNSITNILGSFAGSFADLLLSSFGDYFDTQTNVTIPADGKFSALLIAPTSAAEISIATPSGTTCSNGFTLPK